MGCSDQPGMISLEDCRARILKAVSAIEDQETVALEHACGRILARDLNAQLDMPPADNSAMDGYAFHHQDGVENQQLTVIGEALAGHPFDGQVQRGQCVRIFTGGHLPAGCNSVIMQEDTQRSADTLTVLRDSGEGNNVRRAGEDIRAGDALLAAGRQLRPADIGLLASQGYARVPVMRRLRVALLSTGDELVSPGETLGPGQIHDSNRYALRAMLERAGFDVLDRGRIADDLAAVTKALGDAARDADVVMTSAGVSVGDADHVRAALDALGDILVWRIAIKPGKPFAFGTLPGAHFFGLPGNPVSALVTLQQLAMPALMALQGGHWQPPLRLQAKLQAPVRKKPGRTDFQRGRLTVDPEGQLLATPLSGQGSGLVTSMSRADCFIVLERERGDAVTGESVWVEPFSAPL